MTAHAGDGLSHVYFSRRAGGVAGRHRTPEFDPGPAEPAWGRRGALPAFA